MQIGICETMLATGTALGHVMSYDEGDAACDKGGSHDFCRRIQGGGVGLLMCEKRPEHGLWSLT